MAATNSSSGSGAKAVYGNAPASHGTTYGVYGRATSADGYGVYSAGRLGSSGRLVCSRCVTGADVDAATLPEVPNAHKFAGHASSYYARIVPLSWVGAVGPGDTYRIKGCASSNAFGVTYRTGSLSITSAVVAGTFTTPKLAAGTSTTITLTISVRSAANIGEVKRCLVRATSTADATKVDAPGARLKVGQG